MPEFAVRIECSQTDVDTLREWRVVLGGAVRGGLSSAHGYLPNSGCLVEEAVSDMLTNVRSLLEAYVCSLTSYQLSFEDSQP